MYRYVGFLDSVLEAIEEHIARFPPERGGALLGPVGQPLVTEFIFDPEARTSGVTYTPSGSLADRVRARESADQQIELKGILHSHPGDMSRPSQGDHHAYDDSLEGAPWLGRLVAPIVTVGTRLRREHDVPLPSGTMSVYIAERRPDAPAGVVVERAEPHVLNISRDLKSLASALGGTAEPPFITDIEGQLYVAGVVGCEGFDLQVLVGPAYPFTPPVVIAARRPDAKEDLEEPRLGLHWHADSPASQGLRLAWDLETPDETRLLAALLAAGQAPNAPPAALAALVAGQAALTAGQAALAAAQAALAAGQAALAAEPEAELEAELADTEVGDAEPEAELAAEPEAELEAEPEAEPAETEAGGAEPEAELGAGPEAELAEAEAEDAEETEPGSELGAPAVDEAEAEAEETEPGAATDSELAEPPAEDTRSAEPDAESSEPEAEEVEAYAESAVVVVEEAKPEAEEAEPSAEPPEPQAEEAVPAADEAEPEAGRAPDSGQDTPDDEPSRTPSPGWFGRLLRWIKRVLNPRNWRRRTAARPALGTDRAAEAVPEVIQDADLAAVQGTGQADG